MLRRGLIWVHRGWHTRGRSPISPVPRFSGEVPLKARPSHCPAIVAAMAILLALSACSNVVPVMPKPSDALLTDCPAPQLIPDADKQTADDINIEREVVAQHAVCWRGKFWGLRKWVRGMVK